MKQKPQTFINRFQLVDEMFLYIKRITYAYIR